MTGKVKVAIVIGSSCSDFRSYKFTTSQLCFLNLDSPNVFRLSFLVFKDFSCNRDCKLSVMYERWLPLSNNNLIVVDFVPSSFVVIAVAVCNNTLCFTFAFSEVVVAVVVLEILLSLAHCSCISMNWKFEADDWYLSSSTGKRTFLQVCQF